MILVRLTRLLQFGFSEIFFLFKYAFELLLHHLQVMAQTEIVGEKLRRAQNPASSCSFSCYKLQVFKLLKVIISVLPTHINDLSLRNRLTISNVRQRL